MNNYLYQEAVKDAVKDKFKRKQSLESKVTPRHPMSAERELKRVVNSYMKLFNQELKEELPGLMQIYKVERREDVRSDDLRDMARIAKDKFYEIAADFEKKVEKFGLERKIEKIARQAQKSARNDWKRIVKRTLGVDILESYYNDAFYDAVVKKWVADNVLKIKSISSQSLGEMQHILMDGYAKQKTIGTIAHELQEEFNLDKKKAKMIARDQMGTLNSQITRLQHEDCGCTKYRWSSSNDERVRDCHAEFNGQIFEYANPPAEWYDTKSRGRVYTGNHFNPGEAYQCRCVAIPVFDFQKVDIPMKGNQDEEK